MSQPRPAFDPELPVNQRRDEIARTIAGSQVVVLCGETGSGKTTQLPQICLELGRGREGLIGHTQPRRIAARSVAARIGEELGEPALVGCKVRFDDRSGPQSRIKLMTDGILLAEIEHDRLLRRYDTLIIDEAHERSLNIDFLLGCLKQILPRRPDLKLIITSATIDPLRFSRHFDEAPVIEVSGRTWPVEVRYRPLHSDDPDEADRDLQQGILDAVDELAACGPGDILVFLPGEREIRETAESLRKHHPPQTEILPLYARLTAQEQARIFRSHGGRRIVLATNVAETSLTVPGIRYVVDSGVARISRYSHRAKVQRLPVEKVSQASAEQRKGRCGRVAAGVCIRLYDEEDFNGRPAFTDPEIARTNLAAVILRMAAQRLGAVEDFPFVEPPDGRLVRDGYRLLHELGAVDEQQRLTRLGRQLARFPLDPRIARMVVAGAAEGVLAETLVIAAALGSQDPRDRPHDQREKADEAHRRWHHDPPLEGEETPKPQPPSDFLALLRLWRAYHEERRHLSQNKLRKWCRERFISWLRMREWIEVYSQLKSVAGDADLLPRSGDQGGAARTLELGTAPFSYDAIHRALLSGLLGQIGLRLDEERGKEGKGPGGGGRKGRRQIEYLGARGSRFALFPGSAAQKSAPKWLIAAELVETSRLFARTVAQIEPEWVERLAGHLLKRSHSEPHWEKRAGRVVAFETVTLYGLPLVSRRKVHYGPLAPEEARELFIRRALVEGDYQTRAPFFAHNRALVAEIEALEARGRRRDLLVDDEVLFAFYDRHIPAGIYNGAGFDKWRKQAEREAPRLLFLAHDDLLRDDAEPVSASAFPEQLEVGDGLVLPLRYHFAPGSDDDGVTVVVPLAVLAQVDAARCDWLVPGLREEKIATLLRGLPKALRRNFVPVPHFAAACHAALGPADGNLFEALSGQLRRMTGVAVEAAAWQAVELPAHLRPNFRVVDAAGDELAAGRELPALQQRLAAQAGQALAAASGSGIEVSGLTEWSIGTLPPSIESRQHGVVLRGYPALVDDGETVAVRLFDSEARALAAHRRGLCRLFTLVSADRVRYLRRNLPGLDGLCLHYATLGRCERLREALLDCAVERALLGDGEAPRDEAAFEAACTAARRDLLEVAVTLCRQVGETLAVRHAIERRLKRAVSPAWLEALRDIRSQFERLVPADFLAATPAEWLPHLPRYLKAIELRLDKLERDPGRDRRWQLEVAPHDQDWPQKLARQQQEGGVDPELIRYRWLVEEYRVSLFAQELKTAHPVSAKRLREQWKTIA